MRYQLIVAITTHDGEWQGMKQLPTFLLDERTLGIVDCDHARKIGLSMLQTINPSINAGDVSIQVDTIRGDE